MRAYQNRGESILGIFCKDYDVSLLAVMERYLSVIRSLMIPVTENSHVCLLQDGEKSV